MTPATAGTAIEIVEAWNGPGRRDGELTRVLAHHNAYHPRRSLLAFEHWYFDATLASGHVVIGFLIKRRPEDLPIARPWVEVIVYAPDGTRRQVAARYSREAASFSDERCDVRIGPNRAHVEFPASGFPVHHLYLEVDDVLVDLRFDNETPSWMPGRGETLFGGKDRFGWAVGAPRARVSGTVRLGSQTLDGTGRGYADHNWGSGDMRRVIDRWHWGRLYTDELSLLYAVVLTQEHFGSHAIAPMMLAQGERIMLSTGEVELAEGPPAFDAIAGREYPTSITLRVPGQVELRLDVQQIIHAHDLLDDLPVARNRLVKPLLHRVVGHPGYFRFRSAFDLTVTLSGRAHHESGETLHELVALR